MAKRRKIIIIYDYDEGWIGGAYYIQNLISSLNTLDEHKKPFVNIITAEEKHYEELKINDKISIPLKKLDFGRN